MKISRQNKRLDEAIRKAAPFDKPAADFEKWRQEHPRAVRTLKSHGEQCALHQHKTITNVEVWRKIMKNRITRFAAAATVLMAVVASIILWDKSVKPAWAVEQTIEALQEIRTLIVSGTNLYGSESIPFKCWIKLDDANSLYMRFQDEKKIFVVQGKTAYEYWRADNLVKIKSGPMIHDLKFWYKAAELSPWLAGTMLKTLKVMAHNWQETYGKYGKGEQERDCVFVTCSYEPLSASFWMVFDVESKLIAQGKYWKNTYAEGPPDVYADSFVYNPEIPHETFDFEIPEGARIIDKEELAEARALFDRGEELLHKKRQPAEAIKIYHEVYERYAHLGAIGEEALAMIGISYDHMGQYEKAIEIYKKALREYPNLKGWSESTYFYLGDAYLQIGQKERALEAFKNCLIVGEGVRDSDKFPMREARQNIKRLENKKEE
ncbi:MAG TPA: tetratricopeptide repeat protein [Sedimentisphaerales bacterium]|nr:tetratricopeptide repeat protein [Sedimentisphaerales bacterium]